MPKSLTLCSSCKRHVRIRESSCPFCGARVSAGFSASRLRNSLEAAQTRPRGVPGSRAALFLVGAVAGSGCDETQAVPVYGVAIDGHVPPIDDASARDGGTLDSGEPMVVPVYGVPITVDSGAGDEACMVKDAAEPMPIDEGAPKDAAADASPCVDAGEPLPIPVYGVAIDAGPDAADPDAEIVGIPIYGAAIDAVQPPFEKK